MDLLDGPCKFANQARGWCLDKNIPEPIEVSAMKNENIDKVLDAILQAFSSNLPTPK